MKLKLLSSICLLILAYTSSAQDRFGLNLILGDYSMSDMKALQEEFKEDLSFTGLPFEVVSDFSWSLQAELNYQTTVGNSFIGPFLNYSVAEGRIHYGDYSGESFTEQNFQRFTFGVFYSTNITSSVEVYVKGGLSIIQLDIASKTSINEQAPESSSIKFASNGGSLAFGVDKSFSLNDKFSIVPGIGMDVTLIQGKLNAKDISGAFLINDAGKTVKPDFTGIRLRLGVRYSF